MITDYFALVDPDTGASDEFLNVSRTTAYMLGGLRPSTFVNVQRCGCPDLAAMLGSEAGGTVTETAETTETRPAQHLGDLGAPEGTTQDYDEGASDEALPDAALVFTNPVTAFSTGTGWALPVSTPAGAGWRIVGARLEGVAWDFGSSNCPVHVVAFADGIGGSYAGSATITGAGAAGWTPAVGPDLATAVVTDQGDANAGTVTIELTLDAPVDAGDAPPYLLAVAIIADGVDPSDVFPDGLAIGSITWLWEREVAADDYTNPVDDDAPWYDPLVPESALFAGVIPVSVEGLDSNPVTREVTRLQAGGAALGPLVPTEREVAFRVELIGASCCAVAYGLKWLTSLLTRRCTGEACAHSDLVFLDCCPNSLADCAPDVDEFRSVLRRATGVGLLSGPAVVERRGAGCGSCGCYATMVVEFVLVSGDPRIFGETEAVIAATDLLPEDPGDGCLDLHWRCEPTPDCDADLVFYDAACGSLPPPPAPQISPSCMCDPLAVHRLMVPVPAAADEWASFVASFTLTAGSLPLRNVAFRLFRRTGGECGYSYDPTWDDPDTGPGFDPLAYPPCDIIASLGVTYVPPDTTLVVDGVRRRAYIEDVNGNRYTASRFIYAASGSPFQWIEMGCGGNYCISVEADAFNTHEGATVAIDVTYRES